MPTPPASLTTDCHFALVIPTTLGNLSNIADAIVKSTQLSAKLLSPLPTSWSTGARLPAFLLSSTNGSSYGPPTNASGIFDDFDLLSVPFAKSGYTWLHIFLATILVVAIMIIIIFGNALVVIAVKADKSLKGIQNYFIVSLAVADLLVGLAIMPLSLAVELMGKWIFGQIACNLWLGGDVLLCTASILNLCMISIDRYWSVTLAGQYTARLRKRRVTIMIVLVWILSTVISLPPLVGWARKYTGDDECELMDDVWYIIYSTCGSFYAPLVVMIVVYIRIFVIARRTARKSAFKLTKQLQKKRAKPPPTADELKVALSAVNSYAVDNNAENNNNQPNSQANIKYTDSLKVNMLTAADNNLSTLRRAKQDPSNNTDDCKAVGNRVAFDGEQPQRQDAARKTSTSRFRRLLHRLLLAKYFRRQNLSENDDEPVEFSLLKPQHPAPQETDQGRQATPPSSIMKKHGSKSMGVISEHDDSVRSTSQGVNGRSRTPPVISNDIAIHQASSMLGNVAMSLAVIPRASRISGTSNSVNSELPQLLPSVSEQTTHVDKDKLASKANVSKSPSGQESGESNPKEASAELEKAGSQENLTGCDGNLLHSDNNKPMSPKLPKKPNDSVPPVSLAEEVERRKKRLAKERERRTTRILVIIMLSFIGCWFPFFTLYLVSSLAGFHVNHFVFAIFFWLGYFNSALNPVSYAAFNQDFRAAFKRLLRMK